MEHVTAKVKYRGRNGKTINTKATQMRFSVNCCFAYDNGPEDKKCLEILGNYLSSKGDHMVFYRGGKFFNYLLNHAPHLKSLVRFVIEDDPSLFGSKSCGIPIISPDELPKQIKTVFLCETLTYPRVQMQKKLRPDVEVVTPEILKDLNWHAIPERAWIPADETIYPMDVPEIKFLPNQDLILIDCPSRNLSLMPNGLGYVHNALKKEGIKFQTLDLDIIMYHRFHIHRLFDTHGKVLTPGGKELPDDPWMAESMDVWDDPDALKYFQSEIDETVRALVKAQPKILALSIQQCNINFCRGVVNGVKSCLPDTIILVGGYSCYQPSLGLRVFPECDYMVIGEGDLTIGPLVKRLISGERPHDLPGVLSRYDSSKRTFSPGPMLHDLDAPDMPKYEWFSLDVYRNYNHYRLTPIIASRGCRWSRCKFCGERLFWRIRNPKKFVDELEWLCDHGCDLFVFNESDLNGMPDVLLEICDEIIRRGLIVRLSGQLLINRKNTRAFFDRLRAAGFISLRFGVDGWSKNTLKMQCKGYSPPIISQNLKDCHEAGIYIEVNAVIGAPGETDEDIKESIELMLANKPYIGRLANINPLQLVPGSEYLLMPSKYNIHFREDKQKICEKYFSGIPSNLWYSTNPYIDEKIRQERCERILSTLRQNGFDFGAGAEPKVEAMERKNEVRVESDSPVEKAPSPQKAYTMFRYDNEFYRFNSDDRIDFIHLITKGSFWTEVRSFAKKCHILLQNLRRWKTYVGQSGWRTYTNRFKRFLQTDEMGSSANLPPKQAASPHIDCPEAISIVKLTKEMPPSGMSLVKENFCGYNILKVLSDFYAIKHGFLFDRGMAESGGYEPGACFKGKRVSDVQNLLTNYVSANNPPVTTSEETKSVTTKIV